MGLRKANGVGSRMGTCEAVQGRRRIAFSSHCANPRLRGCPVNTQTPKLLGARGTWQICQQLAHLSGFEIQISAVIDRALAETCLRHDIFFSHTHQPKKMHLTIFLARESPGRLWGPTLCAARATAKTSNLLIASGAQHFVRRGPPLRRLADHTRQHLVEKL